MIVADNKEAIVPPSNARIPYLDNSTRLLPMEAKLANPHSI